MYIIHIKKIYDPHMIPAPEDMDFLQDLMLSIDEGSVIKAITGLGFNSGGEGKLNRTRLSPEDEEFIDELDIDEDENGVSVNWMQKIRGIPDAADCLFNGYVKDTEELAFLLSLLHFEL